MSFARATLMKARRAGREGRSRACQALLAVLLLGGALLAAALAIRSITQAASFHATPTRLLQHVRVDSLSDWSFDEDEPGAYDATLAKLNGPELEQERTVEDWDQLSQYQSDPAVISAGAQLQAAPQVLQLAQWVREGKSLGWCNSPFADQVKECRVVTCLRSVDGKSLDLVQQPFKPVVGLKAAGCALPLGGQRPYRGGQVQVSFMLTLHNNDQFAAKALLELFRTSQEATSVQYSVYDDMSDKPPAAVIATLTALRRSFGQLVQFHRGTKAQGFGGANHEAIRASNGTYIVLVNTDMYVTPGWLAALLFTTREIPHAGLVGPMYIGNNTLVTEAGGIVFAEAGAANFGRGFPPTAHEFAYARRADYISAACVLMLRRLYFTLGGFDPRYEMGYYEDTDLALAVRKAGLYVFYQPGAVVFHQEGNTLGTDESPLKQRLMAQNRQRFHDKWQGMLSKGYMHGGVALQQAAVQRYPGKALWIMHQIAEPLLDIGAVRAMTLLRALLDAGFHVTLQLLSSSTQHDVILQMRIMGAQVVEPRPMDTWGLREKDDCGYDLFVITDSRTMQASEAAIKGVCRDNAILYDAAGVKPIHTALQHLDNHIGRAPAAARVVKWLKELDVESSSVVGELEKEVALVRGAAVTLVQTQLEYEVLQHFVPESHLLLLPLVQQRPSVAADHHHPEPLPDSFTATSASSSGTASGDYTAVSGSGSGAPKGDHRADRAALAKGGEVHGIESGGQGAVGAAGAAGGRKANVGLRGGGVARGGGDGDAAGDTEHEVQAGAGAAAHAGAGVGAGGWEAGAVRKTGASSCQRRPASLLLVGGWHPTRGAPSGTHFDDWVSDVMTRLWKELRPDERALQVQVVGTSSALLADKPAWSKVIKQHATSHASLGQLRDVLAKGVRAVAAPMLPQDEGVRDLALAATLTGTPLVSTTAGIYLLGLDHGQAAVAPNAEAASKMLLGWLRCGASWAQFAKSGAALAREPDGPLSTWAARTAALEVLATLKDLMVA